MQLSLHETVHECLLGRPLRYSFISLGKDITDLKKIFVRVREVPDISKTYQNIIWCFRIRGMAVGGGLDGGGPTGGSALGV
jgi:hypothetical protein